MEGVSGSVMKMKIIWLVLLALIATVVDWLVIHEGLVFPFYHLIGWALVWLICLRIVKSFPASIAGVAVVSVFEDFLYLAYASVVGERTFWPLYSHEWIPDVFGKWAAFLSYDWFGVPSSYYILLGIGLVFLYYKLHPRRVILPSSK